MLGFAPLMAVQGSGASLSVQVERCPVDLETVAGLLVIARDPGLLAVAEEGSEFNLVPIGEHRALCGCVSTAGENPLAVRYCDRQSPRCIAAFVWRYVVPGVLNNDAVGGVVMDVAGDSAARRFECGIARAVGVDDVLRPCLGSLGRLWRCRRGCGSSTWTNARSSSPCRR